MKRIILGLVILSLMVLIGCSQDYSEEIENCKKQGMGSKFINEKFVRCVKATPIIPLNETNEVMEVEEKPENIDWIGMSWDFTTKWDNNPICKCSNPNSNSTALKFCLIQEVWDKWENDIFIQNNAIYDCSR